MERYCFIHAADLHLDTPFEGFRKTAPEVHERLLDASLDAWDALVELTLERRALFLLLGGDLYDGADRGVRAQLRFRRGVAKLCAAGIEVFAVHGNHDPVEEGWSAIREWPSGMTVFSSSEVSSAPVIRAGVQLATIHGISYATRETRENLSAGFHRGDEPGLQIGLLHCNLAGDAGHENYSPCSVADLCAADLDYWALGHVHRHSVVREGEPWIVYPGNLQGRSPQPGERGAKGAVAVEVEGGRIAGVTHVALDRVRFGELVVNAAGCRDLGELEELLSQSAETQLADAGARGLMLRARIRGADERLRADLERRETLADLTGALRDRFAGLEPFLWWDALQVDSEVQPQPAREARADSFSESLRDVCAAVLSDPEQSTSMLETSFEKLPARSKRIELPSIETCDTSELLREGRELALSLLSSEASPERSSQPDRAEPK
jgi:DNA repair exonuclease SbcCD nuclease subunit